MVKRAINGIVRDLTAEEQAEYEARNTAWNNESADRKLETLKEMRLIRLRETDFYALSDVTMSSEMTTYRQSLRDIPQDYTTEEQYDDLLARDEQGNLTHTVWSKP